MKITYVVPGGHILRNCVILKFDQIWWHFKVLKSTCVLRKAILKKIKWTVAVGGKIQKQPYFSLPFLGYQTGHFGGQIKIEKIFMDSTYNLFQISFHSPPTIFVI